MIGYAMCGSFCTLSQSLKQLEALVKEGYDILPIMSFNVYTQNTRFFEAEALKKRVELICGKECVHTIQDAEPLGPKTPLETLVISPCTGNTLAKLSLAITDSPVLMAAKAHLRNERPVVIFVSTNDGLSMNFKNIGNLLNCKNIYFVPFTQDNYKLKPNSLVAETSLILETLEAALDGKQLQPIIRNPK